MSHNRNKKTFKIITLGKTQKTQQFFFLFFDRVPPYTPFACEQRFSHRLRLGLVWCVVLFAPVQHSSAAFDLSADSLSLYREVVVKRFEKISSFVSLAREHDTRIQFKSVLRFSSVSTFARRYKKLIFTWLAGERESAINKEWDPNKRKYRGHHPSRRSLRCVTTLVIHRNFARLLHTLSSGCRVRFIAYYYSIVKVNRLSCGAVQKSKITQRRKKEKREIRKCCEEKKYHILAKALRVAVAYACLA